jgi:hypothetical protein
MATTIAPVSQRRPSRALRGQRALMGASSMVLVGSFLPWVATSAGNVAGVRGAGLWTFYAATLGLAGAVVPSRKLAVVQGAILALAAVVLTSWQVVHLLRLVGVQGWLPGPGLVLTFGGGVVAAYAVRTLVRRDPAQ